MSFWITEPAVASRTFDFAGDAAYETELYGPKVRISNVEDLQPDITALAQLLQQPIKTVEQDVKEQLNTIQFPTKWQEVSDKQYVNNSDFKLDDVALTALVYSRAMELKRDLKTPIQDGNRMIDLQSALRIVRSLRNSKRFLDLDMLQIVELAQEKEWIKKKSMCINTKDKHTHNVEKAKHMDGCLDNMESRQ